MREKPKHPIQPVSMDDSGILRFKENAIVRHLLDWASGRGMDMNKLAMMHFDADDRQHFAQLIGYSLDGYGTLSYSSEDVFDAAEIMAKSGESEQSAKIQALSRELKMVRDGLRMPVARLFGVHPQDLKEGYGDD